MAAPKLFPVDLLPNPGSAWWYEWRQDRTISAAGTTKVRDAGRGVWRARLVFSKRISENARRLHGFFMSLHGWIEPFRIGIHYDTGTRLGSGSITVTVPGTVGYSLPTGGWTPNNNTVLRVGQFIDMTTIAQEPRLQMVTEDAVAVGGVATLRLSPGVQIPTGAGETVHYGNYSAASPARATMFLSNPDEVQRQFSHPVWSDITVDLEEWWPDREGL